MMTTGIKAVSPWPTKLWPSQPHQSLVTATPTTPKFHSLLQIGKSLLFIILWDGALQCNPGWPRTIIFLLQPLECWDCRSAQPQSAIFYVKLHVSQSQTGLGISNEWCSIFPEVSSGSESSKCQLLYKRERALQLVTLWQLASCRKIWKLEEMWKRRISRGHFIIRLFLKSPYGEGNIRSPGLKTNKQKIWMGFTFITN